MTNPYDFKTASDVAAYLPNSVVLTSSPNTLQHANTFQTDTDVVTGSGAYDIPIGSNGLRIEGDGTLKFGPSLLYDTYPQRKMLDGGYDPVSLRVMGRGMLLREVGNPAQIQRGIRPGTFPYAVATTLLTGGVTISGTPANAGVMDTSQFSASGGKAILEPAAGGFGVVFAYTGRSTSSGQGNLTGATIVIPSGGSQVFIAGDIVNAIVTNTTTISTDYASSWMGNGGFQLKGVQTAVRASEDQYPDMTGGYYGGAKWYLSTPTPGPASLLKDRVVVDERGYLGILGGGVEDFSLVNNPLSVGGPASRTIGAQAYNSATITVDSTAGWPTTGTVNDGNNHIFSYTGLSADGKSFTGCTPGAGGATSDIPTGAKLKPDPSMVFVTIATPYGATVQQLKASGLPGATSGARFVGGTVSGAPVSGTFAVRDIVVAAGAVWVCTVAGSPGTWVRDVGPTGPTGPAGPSGATGSPSRAQNAIVSRGLLTEAYPMAAALNALSALTAGQITMALAGLSNGAGDVVTNIVVCIGTAAVGTAPTMMKLAIVKKDGTVLAATANVNSDAKWLSTGYKAFALSSPYTVPADDGYYLAVLQVGAFGTTQPQLIRVGSNQAAGVTQLGSGTFIYASGGTGQTDITGTLSVNSAGSGVSFWLGAN